MSILVINYNNKKLVTRAIRSCLNQTYKKIEVLVYDDQSTDNSINKIKSFKKKIKFFINRNKKKNVAALDAANGYCSLFKKSKGEIICLLDSDDYFNKDKVRIIVNYFKKNKEKKFLQNLPLIKISKNEFIFKENKNSFFSFWPYFAPESCISFRKKFMVDFIKKNNRLKNKYKSVWLGFRMGVYAYYLKNNFSYINEHLTFYESLGESKKYSFFNTRWLTRRKESFEYLYKILNKNKYQMTNIDYFATRLLIKIFKLYKTNNEKKYSL